MALPSTLFLVALLLVVANVPLALGLVINGLTIGSTNIGGIVFCPNTSLATGGTYSVLSQVPVELRCGSGSTDTLLKTVTTDLSGTYLFAFSLLDALIFDPADCYIRVQLASTSCTVSLPSGILRAPVRVLSVIQALLGNLLVCITGPLSLVA